MYEYTKIYSGRNLHKQFEIGHNLQRPFFTYIL